MPLLFILHGLALTPCLSVALDPCAPLIIVQTGYLHRRGWPMTFQLFQPSVPKTKPQPPKPCGFGPYVLHILRRFHHFAPDWFEFGTRHTPVLRASDWILATNQYGSYCVPKSSSHRPAARSVLAGKVWEEETLELLCRSVATGDVVHAGTYFGDFLPALSKAVAPGKVIWAFEPNPESYEAATITCQLNQISNVRLQHLALGDHRGTTMLQVKEGFEHLGGGSRIVTKCASLRSSDLAEVPLARLVDVVPSDRHVSLLHLDVEGSEEQVLAGAQQLIERDMPILVMERLPRKWIRLHMARLGYQLKTTCNGNFVLTPRR